MSAVQATVTVRSALTATCGSDAFWSEGDTAWAMLQLPDGVRSLVNTRSPSGSVSTHTAVTRPSSATATCGLDDDVVREESRSGVDQLPPARRVAAMIV